MKNQHTSNQNKIAYYIDFSIQEIPSIAFIAYKTGGIIYTDSKATFHFIKEDHPKLHVKYYKTIKEIKKSMETLGIKIILYPDFHIRFFKEMPGVKHIQVFHGTSDKVYDFQKAVLEYDLFFIPGQESYDRYNKNGLLKKHTGVLIGYPKLDRVFQGNFNQKSELKKLNLDPENPTVLYAPTWVDKAYNSSWKKFKPQFSKDIPENLNLIIKLHPNLTRYRNDEVKKFEKSLIDRKNTRIFDCLPDIVPLMTASDLLIGDISAVTREYLAFKKPFVFIINKPKWLWAKKKKKLWECGELITDPNKLWPAVERALSNPNKYLPAIEKHFRYTFYKPDGRAAERATFAINQLLKD